MEKDKYVHYFRITKKIIKYMKNESAYIFFDNLSLISRKLSINTFLKKYEML